MRGGSRPVRSVRRHRRTSPFRMTHAAWDPSRLCLCVADGSWLPGHAPGGRPPAMAHDPNPRRGARISLPRIRRCACDKSSGAGTGTAAGHTHTSPPTRRRGRSTAEERDDVGRFGHAAGGASARDAPRAQDGQRTPEPADHNLGWEPPGPSEVPPQHTHTRTSHHAASAPPARTRAAGVARDAAVRAPQLRHAPNQKLVTDVVRDPAAGNTGVPSPQDPDDLPGLGGCDLRAKRRDVSPRAKGP